MKHFNSCIVEKYKDVFTYVVLYINEAHPTNGWYIGDELYKIPTHTSIQDRKQAASYLDDEIHHTAHVFLDNFQNQGQKIFGVKYERLYVLQKKHMGDLCGFQVLYQGGNGPFGYDLNDLDAFLESYVKTI